MRKRIRIIQGDITESDADAIVNAANNHLWMGSGVAGAIKQKGGVEIESEAISKGPIPVGEAVSTTAGKLPAKAIIHAAVMGQDLTTDEAKIRSATSSSLRVAEELGLSSIDFPALGTGVGGFPMERAAEIMVGEARDFLASSINVKSVGFILFDSRAFGIFCSELGAAEIALE